MLCTGFVGAALVAMHRLLIAVASLVEESGLYIFSSCGSRALEGGCRSCGAGA